MYVLLGDQAPFLGGVLRAQALAGALPKGVTGLRYNFHDTDAPWVRTGGTLRQTDGWPPYSSLAARLPWTLDAPDLVNGNLWHGIRQSLELPRGSTYLVGPNTERTIGSYAAGTYEDLEAQVSCLLSRELRWMKQLGSVLGCRPSDRLGALPLTLSETLRAVRARLEDAQIEVGTTSLFWQERPVSLSRTLPAENYWRMTPDGKRQEWDGVTPASGYLVPRAVALSLEVAAAGMALGFSAIPYQKEVVSLRDRYLPGFSVPCCQITFEWQLPEDPVAALYEEFVRRKSRRAARASLNGTNIPELDEEDAERIRTYWRSRPTVYAYDVLGGAITPSVRMFTL